MGIIITIVTVVVLIFIFVSSHKDEPVKVKLKAKSSIEDDLDALNKLVDVYRNPKTKQIYKLLDLYLKDAGLARTEIIRLCLDVPTIDHKAYLFGVSIMASIPEKIIPVLTGSEKELAIARASVWEEMVSEMEGFAMTKTKTSAKEIKQIKAHLETLPKNL